MCAHAHTFSADMMFKNNWGKNFFMAHKSLTAFFTVQVTPERS